MTIGFAIRILEIIVTFVGGVILTVQPNKMRWQGWLPRVLFGVAVGVGIAVEIANCWGTKFSATLTHINAIYLCVLILVFWQADWFQLLAHNFLYWFTVILIQYLVLYIDCYIHNSRFYQYIYQKPIREYSSVYLAGLLFIIILVIFMCCYRWKKAMIVCQSRRVYHAIIVLVFVEEIIQERLYSLKIAMEKLTFGNLMLILLANYILFSTVCIVGVANAYINAKHQRQILNLNVASLKQQQQLVLSSYDEKRRQAHDQRQHDQIIMGYLKENKVEEAIVYLEQKSEKNTYAKIVRYTGLTAIDILLNNKIRKATLDGIVIHTEMDACFCPLDDPDMCVIMGNLLDNAIEATRDVENDRREIRIHLISPNRLFVFEVWNPYEGKRRRLDGHYATTKVEKNNHGLGLQSVERIVQEHNGLLKIIDENKTFLVSVTLFDN